MIFDLGLPKGEDQQAFLDFLNYLLPLKLSVTSATAHVDESGTFISECFATVPSGAKLSWSIFISHDGVLTKLLVKRVPDTGRGEWRSQANDLVSEALASALAKKRTKFFKRSAFYYVGQQLSGEYWYRNVRIAPGFPEDPFPSLINAERVVFIDQDIQATDAQHAWVIGEAVSKRLAARLSFLLGVGLYPLQHVQRWVWPVVDDKPAENSVRFQAGFASPIPTPDRLPKKGKLAPAGKCSGSLQDPQHVTVGKILEMPSEWRKVLQWNDASEPSTVAAFDRASRLFQVALVSGVTFPSVGLAYRVAAVDAASQGTPDSIGFKQFVRRYAPHSTEFLDFAYGAGRSGHFHAGEFPVGEFSERQSFSSAFFDAEIVQREWMVRQSQEMCSTAINAWILEELSKSSS